MRGGGRPILLILAILTRFDLICHGIRYGAILWNNAVFFCGGRTVQERFELKWSPLRFHSLLQLFLRVPRLSSFI